ncbi:hypothetical protein PTI98_007144 [Pleurotus ostreatus]|nr:hypothetical protein PTI98_007144 [Pleurotus ostreatus]
MAGPSGQGRAGTLTSRRDNTRNLLRMPASLVFNRVQVLSADEVLEPENPSNAVILVFPTNRVPAITLRNSDVQTLEPKKWLNDTIIDFGMRFLFERLVKQRPDAVDDFYIFNSFFFTILSAHGYQGVRRWVSKDLFSKAYIVIPVWQENHWYLAIIYKPSCMTESHITGSPERTSVLILDSLGRTHQDVFSVLAAFMTNLLKDVKYADTVHGIECHHVPVPIQPNSYDCGIYVLHLAKTFMRNPEGTYALIMVNVHFVQPKFPSSDA